ncbi:MAG: hypothetical protein ABIO70_03565 [Pseudomonadota bacterium]
MIRMLPLAALLAAACQGDTDDQRSDDTSSGDTGSEEQPPVFDPDDPGVYMFLTLGGLEMMGQPMELAVAGFAPAAREDFEADDADDTPLDTCVVVSQTTPVGECVTSEDCAPEQECVPDYDDDGNPEPGSEHCETPRDLMDVGPLTLEGANTGTLTLTYNSGQSGAYTVAGTDGTVNAGTLAYDTTYTFSGDGDPAKGLEGFSGEVYMPSQLVLTAPAMGDVGWGMEGITASTTADLALAWTGSSDGVVNVDLAGASFDGSSGAIHCVVEDDGAFTIPAAMVAEANLGELAMLNMLTLERATEGRAAGGGLSITAVDTTQTLLVFVLAE